MSEASGKRDYTIWLCALGYFACYVPYSALTKALSKGQIAGMPRPLTGFEILPISVLASMVGMYVFLSMMGWWRFASHREVLGRSIPIPGLWTFLSGLCTAAIIATTTLAYTFSGVSIVFVMLLMRGGVLIIAPMVDVLSGRKVRWFSFAGLGLSFAALLAAFSARSGYNITLLCAVDIAIYLASYFVRLRFMSGKAKSDPNTNRRYFVEEQMVATPTVVLLCGLLALIGDGPVMMELRYGFTRVWTNPAILQTLLVGILSQGTGIFGGLILLDPRENTYCVPVNRSSSILAGVCASYSLVWWLGLPAPGNGELIGAGMILLAILFLTIPPMREKRRARPIQGTDRARVSA